MTTQTLDEMLDEARADESAKGRVAMEAASAYNIAEHALGRWENESKLRRPAAHEGLSRAVETVPVELARRFADLRPKLCMEGVTAVSPDTLANLAALYLAGRPEFAAVLRGLLDEPTPPGGVELLDMSTGERSAKRAELKAELANLARARDAARAEHAAAAQRVSRLELGHVDRPRR